MNLNYTPFKKLPLRKKTVLLRIDANVPIKNKQILDDFKLQEVLPTLGLLMRLNSCVIILTHLGNPKAPSEEFSTKIIQSWFLERYTQVHFANSLEILKEMKKNPGELILFENVRFFTGEKSRDDKEKIDFAKKMAICGDFFVNDAFGTLHRNDTSISVLPTLFDHNHRSLGFLIEKEIENIEKIWQKRPIIVVVGGGKPESKIKFIEKDIKNVEKILLCPLISSAIAKAMADKTPDMSKKEDKKYIFPVDYMVERIIENQKVMIEVSAQSLLETDICISIGHKTLALFSTYLQEAGTTIWNGYMGFLERKETLTASVELTKIIERTKAYTIIAGSDTGYCVRKTIKNHHNKNIVFSTGGGAILAYITEQENLPGLLPFTKHTHVISTKI